MSLKSTKKRQRGWEMLMSSAQNFHVPIFFLHFIFHFSVFHEGLITLQQATIEAHPTDYLYVKNYYSLS